MDLYKHSTERGSSQKLRVTSKCDGVSFYGLGNFHREICMQVKKQQLELDMEQQTGSKLGKEYVKAVYCHPAYLTSVQSTS